MKKKTLEGEFLKRNWDIGHFKTLSILAKKNVRRSVKLYELVDPSYAFDHRDKHEQNLLYDNNFVPIGTCDNGDYLVVHVASTSKFFRSGAVYLMSHDHGMEEAIENDSILPKITRYLAECLQQFLDLSTRETSKLPRDYFDGNDSPYRPTYMLKKKKKKVRR